MLGNFSCFCLLLTLFKKILSATLSEYPDQDWRSFGPDLGPNCLQKLSADDTSRQRVDDIKIYIQFMGAQWLIGRVLDPRQRGRGFEAHRCHCIVVFEQDTVISSLELVQPRKTRPCLTEDCWWDVKNPIKQIKQNIRFFCVEWKMLIFNGSILKESSNAYSKQLTTYA